MVGTSHRRDVPTSYSAAQARKYAVAPDPNFTVRKTSFPLPERSPYSLLTGLLEMVSRSALSAQS